MYLIIGSNGHLIPFRLTSVMLKACTPSTNCNKVYVIQGIKQLIIRVFYYLRQLDWHNILKIKKHLKQKLK